MDRRMMWAVGLEAIARTSIQLYHLQNTLLCAWYRKPKNCED